MIKTILRWGGKGLVFLFPLLLGMAGLWLLAGEPVLDALFSCVSMYALNYGDSPPNGLVELARWLAPLTTVSGILLTLRTIRDQVRGLMAGLLGESVAVYGPQAERERLAGQLGRRGIQGREAVIPARKYILLGEEPERFALCRRILQERPEAEVFLQCGDIPAQSVSQPRLHLFSPEESGARLFWKERCLYARSAQRGHQISIVLLGFGQLGENLLYYGLLDNIFHPQQRIAYHIFGADGRFSAVHTQLDRLGDPVVFHDCPWWESLDLLRQSQLILLLPQRGQTAAARELLLAIPEAEVTAFVGEPGLELLAGQGRLTVYPWQDGALEPERILQESLFDQAKRINLRYAHLYGGVEENEQTLEEEWEKLDAFTRYSNISCADYHDIRLVMLEAMGLHRDPGALPPDKLELLAELEHIRWCRYHLLNNWRPGQPADGSRKDMAARLHRDLVPYEQLDEPTRQKDRDNIALLLSLPQ